MNIRIDENICITSSPHGFIIGIFSGNCRTGKGEWIPKAHYSTFEALLKGLLNEMLYKSTCSSLEELGGELQKIKGMLATIANPSTSSTPRRAAG